METKVFSSMGLAMIMVIIGVVNLMTVQVTGRPKGLAEAPTALEPPAMAPEMGVPGLNLFIVYTDKPTDEANPEPFYLDLLTSALGSEEAAKQALLYSYKSVGSAFSAMLDPEQVAALEKQPGVAEVVGSATEKED